MSVEATWAALAHSLSAARTRREAEAAIKSYLVGGGAPPHARIAGPSRLEDVDLVGIWRRTTIDGETWFVRDRRQPYLNLWADVERIGPKRGRRVLLVGESCARGWPLDPLFNCASALHCLLKGVGADEIEIVDLARDAIKPYPLLHVLQSAMVLEPDAVVIFAGNNFRVDPRALDVDSLAAALQTSNSWRAVLACIERVAREQLAAWMEALGRTLRERQVPALFVIPAENLRDQQLPSSIYNPLLSSSQQRARAELLRTIEQSSAQGDWRAVESHARDLASLEDACGVGALQWLARSAISRQAAGEAIRMFEAARELAHLGLDSYAVRTDELRVRAIEQGFRLVDLTRELLEWTDGGPFDRRLFLDGCHMTALGVVAASRAMAEHLLPLVGAPDVSRDRLSSIRIPVDPRAEAQAHLVGAIFNAHDEELATYHCVRALRSSGDIVDVLMEYADVRLKPGPVVLYDAFHRLERLGARFPGLQYLGLWRPYRPRDATLVRAIGRAVAQERPDLVPAWQAMRLRNRRAVRRPTDLLPFAERDDFDQVSIRREFVTCFHPQIRFRVDGGLLPSPCRLRLVARAREQGSIGKPASLLIDGELAHTWILQPSWQAVEHIVDSVGGSQDVLLTIVWPDPGQQPEDRLERILDAFEYWNMDFAGAEAAELRSRMYTVWGEIHAFRAS